MSCQFFSTYLVNGLAREGNTSRPQQDFMDTISWKAAQDTIKPSVTVRTRQIRKIIACKYWQANKLPWQWISATINLSPLVALLFKDKVSKLKNKFKEYAMSNYMKNKMKEFAMSNDTARATHMRCQTFLLVPAVFFSTVLTATKIM